MEPNYIMTQVMKKICNKEYFEPVQPFHQMLETDNSVVYYEENNTSNSIAHFRIEKRPLRYLKESHKKAMICLINRGFVSVISLNKALENNKSLYKKDFWTIKMEGQMNTRKITVS